MIARFRRAYLAFKGGPKYSLPMPDKRPSPEFLGIIVVAANSVDAEGRPLLTITKNGDWPGKVQVSWWAYNNEEKRALVALMRQGMELLATKVDSEWEGSGSVAE